MTGSTIFSDLSQVSGLKYMMERIDLDAKSLGKLSKEELIEKLLKLKQVNGENEQTASYHPLPSNDSSRRENLLVMRLTTKEQEVQEYLAQLEELRTNVGGGLRSALLDPVVNSLFTRMKEELEQTKEKLDESQQELNAWKFTADSSTGKKLMAKCRSLIQENDELGRMMETGRLARLEGEVAQSSSTTDQLRQGQSENDDLLTDLDNTSEGMQVTIVYLQEQLDVMRRENRELRTLLGLRPDQPLPRSTARAGALRNDFDLDSTPPPSELQTPSSNTNGNGLESSIVNGHSPPPPKTARLDEDTMDYVDSSPDNLGMDQSFSKRRTRNYRKDMKGVNEVDDRNIFEKLAITKEQQNGVLQETVATCDT